MEFRQYEKDDPKSDRRCVYVSKVDPKVTAYTKHGPQYFPVLLDIFKKYNPEMLIELGTCYGGATLVFHEEMPDVEIHTFDNKADVAVNVLAAFDLHKVYFYVEDILDNNLMLADFLRDNAGRRKILYCDNGNKEKELKTYAKYLAKGDVIGCHDWISEVNPEVIHPFMDFMKFAQLKENVKLREEGVRSRFWIKL
jgi:cephalosporin hydroxylase